MSKSGGGTSLRAGQSWEEDTNARSRTTTEPPPLQPDQTQRASRRRPLGVFLLSMITFWFITGLGNITSLAETGLSSVFYLVFGAITLLVPVALVTAELASAWPRAGGVYLWVSEAFGTRVGFVAMWFVWASALVGFPGIFAYLGATAVFSFEPELADSAWFVGTIAVVVGWGATLLTFLGIRVTGILTTIANALATLVPATVLIALGSLYVVRGHPTQIEFTAGGLFPSFGTLAALSIAVSAYFTFAGGENAAQYVTSVRNPRRSYPRAMFLAAGLSVLVLAPATVITAATVPRERLSLAAGVMESFEALFDAFSLGALVPVLAVLITIGAAAGIPNAFAATAAGLRAATVDGHLPARFARTNGRGVPVALLVLQAALTSLVSIVFFALQNVNFAFWLLIVLGLQATLVYYTMMYAAALRLRYSQPDTPRPFRVPGGAIGIWIVAGGGFALSLGALGLGFVPPSELADTNTAVFVGVLVATLLATGLSGVLISRRTTGSVST